MNATPYIRIDRRSILAATAAAGAGLLIPQRPGWAAAPANPVVDTDSGKIRGATTDGIAGFKGVPYGASTAGANRFMPPRRPEKWAGVRDALDWAGHAPQAFPGRRRPELAGLSGPPDKVPESEDCLTLNVWTPGIDAGKRPVMVWLHGGGFSYGSANTPRVEGANLARRGDVVVVTVNHRLNIFGFLDLAELGGERFAHSGNAGVLDLVAALQWVHTNIGRFGGNPGNVTIFGQSGGGGKVSALLAMPAAKGLFHRAIVMSGAGIRMAERPAATKIAETVLPELNLTAKELDKLQAVPIPQMLAAIGPALKKIGPPPHPLLDRYGFGPVVEGHDLPHHPFDPVATDISDAVPVMVGGTKDENAIFLAPDDAVWSRTLDEDGLRARVAKIPGVDADAVVGFYHKANPAMNPADLLIAITTASNFWVRGVMLAERKAAKGKAPVYMYSFNWQTPVFDGKLKAPHAIDVPFVFDTIDVVGITDRSPVAHKLAAAESATWAAFAHAGNPDNKAIPHWPAYDTKTRATMMIDADWRVQNDPDAEARLMWEKIAMA
ncbi:MAG TPA: carboxylesterase/lipase family protein [Stellaceae bacterium]|jgi:para-nitrobenzyl esterase|nr:carboxylesterase/lipase family protein [Stellaceae bacterium]